MVSVKQCFMIAGITSAAYINNFFISVAVWCFQTLLSKP